MVSQIRTALSLWNTANGDCKTNGIGNCSGVTFVTPPPAGTSTDLFFFGDTTYGTEWCGRDF